MTAFAIPRELINVFLSDTIVRTTRACRSILTGICLNAIAETKAEPELSIRFTVRDGSAVKSALLEAAAENAREKAQILCRASGVELGRLLTVNYDWSEIDLISPTGYAIERASLKRSAAVPDCIEPEDIKVRDTVAFVWEIV